MESYDLVDFITGDLIKISEPELDKPVEYPHVKFKDAKSKPSLKVRGVQASLTQIRAAVLSFIKGNKMLPSAITHYLYILMTDIITDELEADWVSYTITIPKGTITPGHLVDLTLDDSTAWTDITTPELLDRQHDPYLLLCLMCMYRFAASHEKQREILAEKIKSMLSQARHDQFLPTMIQASNTNLPLMVSNPQLDFLVACLDMFFVRFPRNEFAGARFGTIITRYQGCSGYSNLVHFKKILGIENIHKAVEWFFSPQMRLEILQMTASPEQEWVQPHSYLPYMMCFRLSEKSPYSANNNPAIHTLTHIVGTLLGNVRSKNAILLGSVSMIPIAVNAAIIYLTHRHLVGLAIQFASKKSRDRLVKIKALTETYAGDLTSPKLEAQSAAEWFSAYEERDYKLEEGEIRAIQSAIQTIEEPRQGTIGHWVSRNFLPLLTNKSEE
ncbi:nucleocapsid [Wuhan Louse Fly Virus 10]|uniref:Nucleoprotein n=1 Tax=Wuhan Louse Fly Virus 10 TaxID=1608114 RepID=A0A0B5KXR7_9RHAB|nr:nucleocapsid [Wuhan Louse Fly Virus 10]AJG39208.1 nucleocapsid [Wuhan Louse Fly Virus 10]